MTERPNKKDLDRLEALYREGKLHFFESLKVVFAVGAEQPSIIGAQEVSIGHLRNHFNEYVNATAIKRIIDHLDPVDHLDHQAA